MVKIESCFFQLSISVTLDIALDLSHPWIWNNHTINKKKKRWIINMNLSFEVEVLANIKGGFSIIYFCILIELPRKSAAFLPLLNLPVKTLLGKSMT